MSDGITDAIRQRPILEYHTVNSRSQRRAKSVIDALARDTNRVRDDFPDDPWLAWSEILRLQARLADSVATLLGGCMESKGE